MITGQSPSDIENTWDEGDVNWVLAVNRAQQEARIAIAKFAKTEVHNIATPCSVVIRADSEE